MVVHPRAFALADVLVGTILLGVSLAAGVGLVGRALNSQRVGAELETAAMLADEQLEMVLAHGPDDYEGRFATRGECDTPFERYSYDVGVSGGSVSTPYEVSVRISWMSGAIARSITVETLAAARLGDETDPRRDPLDPVERVE